MKHFEPADLLEELQQYYTQESEFDELLLSLLLEYSTSEDNERYEEEYNSDDNYDSNYNMIDKPSIQEVEKQLKEYLHYSNREINEKILEMVIDVIDLNVLNSWLNDLKKLTNYEDIMSWDDEKEEDNKNHEENNNNDDDDDEEEKWTVITNEKQSDYDYPFYGCPILYLYVQLEPWGHDDLFGVVLNELDGPFNSFKEIKIKFMKNDSQKRIKRLDIPENKQQEFLQAVNKYCDILQTGVKTILNKDFGSLFEKWESLEPKHRIDPFTDYIRDTYTDTLKNTYSDQDYKVIKNIENVIVCAFCNEGHLVPFDSNYKNVKLTDFIDSKTINEQNKLYDQQADSVLNDIINGPLKYSNMIDELDLFGLCLEKEEFINYYKESDGTFEGFINTIDKYNEEPMLRRIKTYQHTSGSCFPVRELVLHKFYEWIKKEAGNDSKKEEDYVKESLKSEDTGTIISDETPVEAETTEVIPEIDIDDLCNSLQNSESINELGNIIIVIPDGEIKDNAKAAFDKCMSEYNFDTNYVANSITEAIHNTTNKLVSEAKITDYMNQQELDKAIKSNPVLKNVVRSYQVLDDMIIEITSEAGKSYYKAILNDDGEIELFWISKDGKKLGDAFPLLSESCEKLDEAEDFKYSNKEYTGLDTYTYTFTLDQEAEFEKAKEELAKTGTVTEIFINNGYGLEYKKDKNI